jgi:ferritin-like metal-binding protein YciE
MTLDTTQDLLVYQLRELYSAERQIVRAWPVLASCSTSRSLRLALQLHRDDSTRHVVRLEQALELLDAEPLGVHCVGMERLLTEALTNAGEEHDPATRDALILGDCQRVEGYEMAVYSSARVFAESLGLSQVVALLERTLTEEEVADAILSQIERAEVRPASLMTRRLQPDLAEGVIGTIATPSMGQRLRATV